MDAIAFYTANNNDCSLIMIVNFIYSVYDFQVKTTNLQAHTYLKGDVYCKCEWQAPLLPFGVKCLCSSFGASSRSPPRQPFNVLICIKGLLMGEEATHEHYLATCKEKTQLQEHNLEKLLLFHRGYLCRFYCTKQPNTFYISSNKRTHTKKPLDSPVNGMKPVRVIISSHTLWAEVRPEPLNCR